MRLLLGRREPFTGRNAHLIFQVRLPGPLLLCPALAKGLFPRPGQRSLIPTVTARGRRYENSVGRPYVEIVIS